VWPMSTEGLAIGISAGAVAIRKPGSPRSSCAPYAVPSSRKARASVTTSPNLRDALAQALGGHKSGRQASAVVVGDDLSRHWVQPPPRGVASLRELQAVAASRFQDLFGEPAAGWSIAGDWRTGRPFVCAAIPHWVIQTVQQAIPVQRAALQTQLSTALRRLRPLWPNDGWWCVHSPATLTIGRTQDGGVAQLRILAHAGASADDVLRLGARKVRQESARDAAGTTARATWIDLTGTVPKNPPDRAADDGIVFTAVPVDLQIGNGASLGDLATAQAATAAALGARVEAAA